jgi:hypothetical protein
LRVRLVNRRPGPKEVFTLRAPLAAILTAVLMPLFMLNPPAHAAGEPPTIVLAGAADVRNSAQGAWLDLIYREAFRRLGYNFKYLAYPARRATVLSDHGDVDGEIHRVADYGKVHPNLVRVDEPHFSARFAAYASRPLAVSDGWDSLAQTRYRIEYRMGNLKCETELPPRVDAARLSTVASAALGLRKLAAGRTDLYIDGELMVEGLLRSPEFRSTSIHQVALMDQINGYAFLQLKHKALAGRLSATLARMKKEGVIEAYRIKAMDAQAKLQSEPLNEAP